jgi:hypothetical protein
MKREDLKAKGLTDEQIDFVMAENGKDVEGHKTKLTTAQAETETIKTQLSEANKAIEAFKGLNIDQIKASADEWKTKAEQAEAARAADKFDNVLKDALKEYKVKDPEDVMHRLKKDALKLGEDGKSVIGLKEQIEPLKSTKDYLFESDTPTPRIVAGGNNQTVGDAVLSAARKAAGLPV